MLIILVAQILKCLHVLDLVKYFSKIFHHIRTQNFDIFQLDELEELKNGRFQEIVASIVPNEGFNDGCKKIAFNDISEI